MHIDRPLALSFALVAAACGDSGSATSTSDSDSASSSSGGSTGAAPTTQTTEPTTEPPTGTDATAGETGPTGDPTATSTDPTTGDTGTNATTQGLTDTGEPSTGTTVVDDTTGTTGDTSGTTTTGDTTGDTTGTTGDTMGPGDDEIYQVQDGTIAAMSAVDVQGVIVTGINPGKTGMFVQEPGGGEYSGVWVYVGKMGPDISKLALGDEVNITGSTAEFNDLTEIDASMGTVVATGVQGLLVDPELLPIATFSDPVTAEPWEAVHVGVVGAPLTVSELIMAVEFKLGEPGGAIVVDDLLYSTTADKVAFPKFGVDATFTAAAGPLNQQLGVYKIAPRSAADLEGYMPPANPKLGVEDLKAGDLVITEVMYNPTCANDDCEWIEVYNAAAEPIDLLGLIIQDDAQNKNQQGVVAVSAVVDPGKYAVLGYKTMATWPYPNPPAAFYGSLPALGNGANGDQVFLKNSKLTIDGMAKWVGQAGKDQGYSFKLDPAKVDAAANDVAANWCYSSAVFYTNPMNVTEKGSPAAVNEAACAML